MKALLAAIFLLAVAPVPAGSQEPARPRNIILILSDDHRFDFMGFHERAPDFLATPGFDRMAAEGAHLANAFVNTALCSPSRASILTGMYPHEHGVVDNQSPLRQGLTLFPEILRAAGYTTAFVGKWHMGEHTDDPQPGFDRWVSFPGQGVYFDPELNIDGQRRKVEGYITDVLTEHALDWLDEVRDGGKPFMLYFSHKAVHAEFMPAPRHKGRFADIEIPYPATMADTQDNYEGKPLWVRAQRSSWHGVDYLFHGAMTFDELYRGYAETLLGLDESVSRILSYLDENGLADSTLVLYMSDNGFLLGEHGLIDKRHAYEESMRVPMLVWAPGLVAPGSRIEEMLLNVDVVPTLLELAGATIPETMDGASFLPLLRGEDIPWRDEMLFVYYWEFPFPHTPTVLALREERYKYIFYHGVWDTNELYDLEVDPRETRNRIEDPDQEDRVATMRRRLFDLLEAAGAMYVPFHFPGDWQAAERAAP